VERKGEGWHGLSVMGWNGTDRKGLVRRGMERIGTSVMGWNGAERIGMACLLRKGRVGIAREGLAWIDMSGWHRWEMAGDGTSATERKGTDGAGMSARMGREGDGMSDWPRIDMDWFELRLSL